MDRSFLLVIENSNISIQSLLVSYPFQIHILHSIVTHIVNGNFSISMYLLIVPSV